MKVHIKGSANRGKLIIDSLEKHDNISREGEQKEAAFYKKKIEE